MSGEQIGSGPPFGGNKPDYSGKESQKLFYVHIPQDNILESSRVMLKTSKPGSIGQASALPLSSKISSLPSVINTSKLQSPGDTKLNLKDSNSQMLETASKFVTRPTIGSGLSPSLKGAAPTATTQITASTNILPIRSVMKAPITVSLANNRSVATVFRSSTAPASLSISTARIGTTTSSTGTSITFVSSNSTTSIPNLGQLKAASAKTQVVAKSTKPIILQPKVLPGSKAGVAKRKVLSQSFLPVGNSVRSAVSNRSGAVSYSLQTGVGPMKEILSPKKDGYFSSFTPPPLILQSGGASKSQSGATAKGSSATISIVTGKGGLQTTTKSNMFNFKITNGQIQNDSSSLKIDGVIRGASRQLFTNKAVVMKNETSSDESAKDILQEAISAVASDAQETGADTVTSESPKDEPTSHLPSTIPSSQGQTYPVIVSRPLPVSSSSNIIPVMIPASASGGMVPVVVSRPIQSSSPAPKIDPEPISASVNDSTHSSVADVPGLIIRTDSVTVRRKIVDSVSPPTELQEAASSEDSSDLQSKAEEDTSSTVNYSTDSSVLPTSCEQDSSKDSVPMETQDSSSKDDKDKLNKLLDWDNGTGTLCGSELKFCMNEFDALELVEDGELEKIKECLRKSDSQEEKTPEQTIPQHVRHARKPSFKGLIKDEDSSHQSQDSDSGSKGKDYDICCCKNCGCYGLSSEFHKEKENNFCTVACSMDYEEKEIEWSKERLRLERQRQKAKKNKVEKEGQDIKQEESNKTTENNSNNNNNNNNRDDNTETKIENPNITPKFQHPWRDSKNCFLWTRYLEYCGKHKGISKAAPLKLWSEPFPFGKCLFRPSMKLEGIDPYHQSLFCVMTVTDIVGSRIRLHFDGYSDLYDFWCNADTTSIFPLGWCEKNGRKLEIPPGIANFSWKLYLDHCQAQAPPRQAFNTRYTAASMISLPNNFRTGMKLEAEDQKNGWICVSTVADVLDNKILVHYDGWEKGFDTWFDVTSPHVHPVGWCRENGLDLYPPKDYENSDSFNWHEYLQESNSMSVPARAFKPRSMREFKSEMKIEAVDKRNPMLIRVATVTEVKDYRIKLHFDGWEDNYDYWVDDDSPDIHPPSWCSKTGHPLQPPLTQEQCAEDVDSGISCGTPGCKGFGHIKGLIYNTHHTAYGCPYSLQNLNKELEYNIPDRLEPVPEKKKGKGKKIINLDPSKPIQETDDETQTKRVRKRRRFFDELSPPEIVKAKMPKLPSEENVKVSSISVKPLLPSPPTSTIPSNTTTSSSSSFDLSCAPRSSNNEPVPISLSSTTASQEEIPLVKNPPKQEMNTDTIVHQSIFNPGYNPKPHEPPPQSWKKHKHILPQLGGSLSRTKVERWSSTDIKELVSKIPGCESASFQFISQEIDGESLLLMTQNDLVNLLEIKLGPAIKIMALILQLRSICS